MDFKKKNDIHEKLKTNKNWRIDYISYALIKLLNRFTDGTNRHDRTLGCKFWIPIKKF